MDDRLQFNLGIGLIGGMLGIGLIGWIEAIGGIGGILGIGKTNPGLAPGAQNIAPPSLAIP